VGARRSAVSSGTGSVSKPHVTAPQLAHATSEGRASWTGQRWARLAVCWRSGGVHLEHGDGCRPVDLVSRRVLKHLAALQVALQRRATPHKVQIKSVRKAAGRGVRLIEWGRRAAAARAADEEMGLGGGQYDCFRDGANARRVLSGGVDRAGSSE